MIISKSTHVVAMALMYSFYGLVIYHCVYVQDPDAGRGWRQEEKGTAEDEMTGWRH